MSNPIFIQDKPPIVFIIEQVFHHYNLEMTIHKTQYTLYNKTCVRRSEVKSGHT